MIVSLKTWSTFIVYYILFGTVSSDIGPETCGQDRKWLAHWFMKHGSPELILPPKPDLVSDLTFNPYDDPNQPPEDPDKIQKFCAMKWSDVKDEKTGLLKYWLKDFPSEEAAVAAGFVVTHYGQCATCSSLQDLGAYLAQNLSAPILGCYTWSIFPFYPMVSCMRNLGFSDMCISIWAGNVYNTQKQCRWTCLWGLIIGDGYNKPDGSLSNCLQCDEDKSGPNFKYYSGRTRRNSGIISSIHRPSKNMYNMSHCYWYDD